MNKLDFFQNVSKHNVTIIDDLMLSINNEKLKSPAIKRKVGALITDNDFNILAKGFNYRSINCASQCENHNNETFDDVYHAEESAIMNMFINNSYTDKHKFMFCTYSPCMNCCRLLVQAQINVLIYENEHKSNFTTPLIECGISPKNFLIDNGVLVMKYDEFKKSYLVHSEKKRKTAIIHHTDPDGYMCGYLLRQYYIKELNSGNAKLYEYSYEPFAEWMSDDSITDFIFADVTPPTEWLSKFLIDSDKAKKVSITIYDHHQDRYDEIVKTYHWKEVFKSFQYAFDSNVAGCMIVMNELSPDINDAGLSMLSQLIEYISIYDTWKFEKHPHKDYILALNTYLFNIDNLKPFTEIIVSCLTSKKYYADIIKNGMILIEFIKKQNIILIKNGRLFITEKKHIHVFIYNGEYPNYWLDKQIEDHFECHIDFVVNQKIKYDKKIIKFSLRTRNDKPFANKIAKYFGGGGHPSAAGYSIDLHEDIDNHIKQLFKVIDNFSV